MKFGDLLDFILYIIVLVSLIVWIIDGSVQHGINVLVPLGVLILSDVQKNSLRD